MRRIPVSFSSGIAMRRILAGFSQGIAMRRIPVSFSQRDSNASYTCWL